jgi:D-glutamate N-acetyltransferase
VSDGKLAVLTEGLFDDHHAKTAHGVIRYGTREVVAVVDSSQAGRTASEVVPFCEKPVPIVATIAEAVERGAGTMLIGVAPTGGRLDDAWRALVLEAIDSGLNIESGLHTILADDPQFRAAADERGVQLRDLRLTPPDLGVPRGPNGRRPGVRVVHSVGSDVAIGKKAVTVELDAAARARGMRSVYVPTGQTGIAIAGWGIAVDHVLSDYVSGAAERLVDEGGSRGDLLFVEGQGSLFHPAYSAVTLGLLHGCSPDVLVLAHRADATHFEGYPDVALPPLPELIEAYEMICRPLRPARVAAIALNTSRLSGGEAREAIARTEDLTGLPADDLVRFGPDRVLEAVLKQL